MTIRTFPYDLYPNLVSLVRDDQSTLTAFCLVDSNFRHFATRHLYAKRVFRTWESLQTFFLGRTSEQVTQATEEERRDWKEGGRESRTMEGRLSELSPLKHLEIDLQAMGLTGKETLEPHPRLTAHGRFPINILRVQSSWQTHPIANILQLLAPRRLVTNLYVLPTLLEPAVTPDRPIVLDTYGPYAASTPNVELLSIGISTVVWQPLDRYLPLERSDYLRVASFSARLMILVGEHELAEGLKVQLKDMRKEGLLEEKDVQVVERLGVRRSVDGLNRSIWNDALVEDLLE
jgi:hypothetical protein